jgi:hypothetical protein
VKILARVALTGVLLAVAVAAGAGEVRVSFANGLVTVIATEASPRQILGEWAKLGQVRITNLERLTGGPVTIQITSIPEAQALETLLRGTAGYVAAPRAGAGEMASLSRYDRILLMPGVAPAVVPAAPAPTTVNRGRAVALPSFDAQDDDDPETQPRAMPTTVGMPQRFGSGGAVPGRPAPMRPPVTDPNPNPNGLANPVKPPAVPPGTPGAATPGATTPGTMTPGTTTPPGPIKKGPGGEG